MRSLFLVFHDAGLRRASQANVTFSPDLSGFEAIDFFRAKEIIARAASEVEPTLDLIEQRYREHCGKRLSEERHPVSLRGGQMRLAPSAP